MASNSDSSSAVISLPKGGGALHGLGETFTPDLHTGVGFGVRWRSPVGPVRVDIARGLNDPDSDYEIYLNIGADW